MSTSSQHDPAGSGAVSDGRRRGDRATTVGTIIGAAGLLVSILAWQWPRDPAADATPAPPSANTSPPAGTTASPPNGPTSTPQPTPSAPAGPGVFLADDLTPEAGGDKLVDIPRAVRGRPDYNRHAIAIRCPSNASDEPVTEVTYLLSRHYRQFDATVHPYYPPDSDVQAATYVTAIQGVRQRDGSLTTSEAGAQQRSRPGAPRTLTAVVEKAEKLTIRVDCGEPAGVVMLTDARLTPA
ncbi:hypothetical protein [Micromonospora sp. CB01531]|uniref:hypothetical protein n=1 Tax=Micromonospora sp. CB01531 TaxID=1718947 RepID=UPI00093A6422|nr:hypothetical protein [Micromonospora sp. CB01531]OKI61457.1 hypothetical protein A6A27_27945 [Micromonospora sp. CB01531]